MIGRLRTLKASVLANGKASRSLLVTLGLLLGTVSPAAAASLPAQEWAILREVATGNGLSEDETWLLAAIRLHENGRPGLEFGIGGPMNSGHRAHRYRDGVKSFRVQCAWAAGTIKRRYTGDLVAFGKRYNPLNAKQWSKNIAQIIARLKRHHRGILPSCFPAAALRTKLLQ